MSINTKYTIMSNIFCEEDSLCWLNQAKSYIEEDRDNSRL